MDAPMYGLPSVIGFLGLLSLTFINPLYFLVGLIILRCVTLWRSKRRNVRKLVVGLLDMTDILGTINVLVTVVYSLFLLGICTNNNLLLMLGVCVAIPTYILIDLNSDDYYYTEIIDVIVQVSMLYIPLRVLVLPSVSAKGYVIYVLVGLLLVGIQGVTSKYLKFKWFNRYLETLAQDLNKGFKLSNLRELQLSEGIITTNDKYVKLGILFKRNG